MPFTKGTPKPPSSGRKKGVSNRLVAEARTRLEELGCDPIEGMARLAMDKASSGELRGRMYSELAKYVWPQRKAVEHSGIGGGPIELADVSGTQALEARIAGIASRIGTPGGNTPAQ